MYKLFKQGNQIQIPVILLFLAVLWSRAFVDPVNPVPSTYFAPLYDLIFHFLSRFPVLCSIIALVLVTLEGIWLNFILVNYKITKSNNLLPLLIYILVMSWNDSMLTITPMLFVNLMLIALVRQLLTNGGTVIKTSQNLNAAFFIGLASIVYFPAIYILIAYAMVFVVYKMYNRHHITIALLGFAVPLTAIIFYGFMTNKLEYWFLLLCYDIPNAHLRFDTFDPVLSLCGFIFIVYFIMAFTHVQNQSSNRLVHQRINTAILSFPIISGIIILFYTNIFPPDSQVMAVPFTFYATLFIMAKRKREFISNLLIWILLLCTIAGVWWKIA